MIPKFGTPLYIEYWDRVHATKTTVYKYDDRHDTARIAHKPSWWENNTLVFHTRRDLKPEAIKLIKEGNVMNKNDVSLNELYIESGTKIVSLVKKTAEHTEYAYYAAMPLGGNVELKVDTDYLKPLNVGNLNGVNIPKGMEVSLKHSKSANDLLITINNIDTKVKWDSYESTVDFIKKFNVFIENYDLTLEMGKSIAIKDVTFEEPEVTPINIGEGTVQAKYAAIVGNMSNLTASINKGFSLDSHKELADSFAKAKVEIQALVGGKPSKMGVVGKWINTSAITKKLTKDTKEFYTKSQSTQDTIDYIFGAIYTKYDSFIGVAENLQKAKGTMNQQIDALKLLLKESTAEMKTHKKKIDIPIRVMVLNTEIKTSIEKYKQRLVKIDGAIVATQATIMALAKDLPSMKTDLTDEMAIGALLSSVDDYQKMYEEVASLVAEATEVTAEKTHRVVENLMDMQINDKHAIRYLGDSSKRTAAFTRMFKEKTALLVAKHKEDAVTVSSISQTILPTTAPHALLK